MPALCHVLLPPPDELARAYPTDPAVHQFREIGAKILRGEDLRIVIILGPCSIHDPEEALEYGAKIKEFQSMVGDRFFLIMRVFFEKPRTRLGWKGLLYDPHLDGSNDLAEGLRTSRKLLSNLAQMGVPCATEFLDPLVATYLADLISWGLIGARTAASQPHRQLASGLPFPVGFKNGTHGEIEPSISGIVSAKMPHAHFSINPDGRICAALTTGNPLAHLVLRGSEKKPNCDSESVLQALKQLKDHHVEERLVIDCAHGNSGKDIHRQKLAFTGCLEQIRSGNTAIRGLMLESHLNPGKQAIPEELDQLLYGVSITDPCLGWDETTSLLINLD